MQKSTLHQSLCTRKWRRVFGYLALLTLLMHLSLVLVGKPPVELRVFFYPTAQAIVEGSSPWIDGGLTLMADRNLNSPFGTLLLTPLAWFSIGGASVLLGLALTGLSLLGALFIARCLDLPKGLTVVVLLLSPASLHALDIGQMTPLILLLLALGCPSLASISKQRFAFYVGLACGLKLFVGILVVPMLLWRRWRCLEWFAFGGFTTIVAGWLAFGTEGYLSWWQALRSIDWYHHAWNVSIIGWGHRLDLVAASYLATLAIIGLSSIAMARLHGHPQRGILALALLCPCMILCSPLGWSYYQPLMAITLLVGLSQRWTRVQLAAAATPLLFYPSWGYGVQLDTLLSTFACVLSWSIALQQARNSDLSRST